jgi:hypothetical protein
VLKNERLQVSIRSCGREANYGPCGIDTVSADLEARGRSGEPCESAVLVDTTDGSRNIDDRYLTQVVQTGCATDHCIRNDNLGPGIRLGGYCPPCARRHQCNQC